MYAAHFAPALAAKGLIPRVPLWVLLGAAYALDVIEYGVEFVRGRPPGLLDAYLLPSGLGMAVLLGGLYYLWQRDAEAAVAVAVTAATHLLLDAVAYGLSLWPGGPTTDVQLVGRPVWRIVVELALLLGGWLVYRRSLLPSRRWSPSAWGVWLAPAIAMAVYYLLRLAP